ncbi:MAG: universal stress protein [Gemmataceae bacterium]|nr:universal stress protein [Gemmataceae bacterium]
MVSRILVPVDLTPLGEAKLPVTQEYARAFNAEVLLLHVLPPKAMDADVVLPTEATARGYLDILVAGMAAAGVRAAALLRTGPTAASIVEEAWEHNADLIILGANVRPMLRSVVIGSVADEVVRNAHCPVLLVRPSLDQAAPAPLRSFGDDATRAGPLRRRSLGVRTVEVGRIIGTVGRVRELGPDFRPLKKRKPDEDRLNSIRRAMEDGKRLPPLELYKLGFGYYVLDGHHRVAVARELDVVEMEAEVTEFVPLADPEAARTFAERRAFERSTGILDIGATHPESYKRIGEMIEAYRAEHNIPDYRDAAQRWYGAVYRPLWHQIRQDRLAHYFPGDRSADVVGRIWAWRTEMLEHGAPAVSWEAALDGFSATLAGQHPPRPRARGWAARQPARGDLAPAPSPTPSPVTPEPPSPGTPLPESELPPPAHDTETR